MIKKIVIIALSLCSITQAMHKEHQKFMELYETGKLYRSVIGLGTGRVITNFGTFSLQTLRNTPNTTPNQNQSNQDNSSDTFEQTQPQSDRQKWFAAAISGDKNTIKKLLAENTVNINTQDTWGNTALHKAVLADKSEIIRLLIHKGADVTKRNNNNISLDPYLMDVPYALKNPNDPLSHKVINWKQLKRYINEFIKLDKYKQQVFNALMSTVNYKNLHQLATVVTFALRNTKGDNPLHYAIEKGDKKLIAYILAINPGLLLIPNDRGLTPFDLAINRGLESLKVLLDISFIGMPTITHDLSLIDTDDEKAPLISKQSTTKNSTANSCSCTIL